ncbi:MAG: hypothetical protein BWZ01_00663 [Deltaproteobacteria bacterium ADurb.BinA179]|nr:MAG: hypothetical protein BWZ01_00663 [Deltaproteobacteria bacterium ADurb.BinA179]
MIIVKPVKNESLIRTLKFMLSIWDLDRANVFL